MSFPSMILYGQIYEAGEAPRDYYDPHILIANQNFAIRPNEEVMVVIDSSGYRYSDDAIRPLNFKLDDTDNNNSNIEENFQYTLHCGTAKQLVLLIKNNSSNFTIYVGQKSPLIWLLDMPRVSSKLCFCHVSDLTNIKLNLNKMSPIDKDNNPEFIDAETIVIHY